MAIHHWDNSRCAMSGVRFNLIFGTPDARNSHLSQVGFGSGSDSIATALARLFLRVKRT
jgi:hypothetical protein